MIMTAHILHMIIITTIAVIRLKVSLSGLPPLKLTTLGFSVSGFQSIFTAVFRFGTNLFGGFDHYLYGKTVETAEVSDTKPKNRSKN